MEQIRSVEDGLAAIGGRLWERGGQRRMYYGAGLVERAIGLEIQYYGVTCMRARRRGVEIDTAEGQGIHEYIQSAGYYVDLATGEPGHRDPDHADPRYAWIGEQWVTAMQGLIAEIRQAVAAVAA